MTTSFIEVEPSGAANRVKVKTELVANIEIPTYIITGQDADGDYKNVSAVDKDGKVSLYTVAGFSDTQSIQFDVKTASTLIAYQLIDISNAAIWPHTNTGEIVIEYIILQVSPDTNFTGEVKIGYLTNVDADNGDFNQILDIDMSRKSGLFHENMDFGTHGVHCTDEHHFGPKLINNTLFQTDTNLGGPDDPATLTYPSGDNDLVLIVDGDGTNTVAVSITIGYETVA
jgi:hypothetical protein